MAEEHHSKLGNECEVTSTVVDQECETKDRGLFDFLGKKEEEKPQEEVLSSELEQVHVSEPEPPCKIEEPKEEEEKKPSLLEKLHRSDSSSSSSSDEEEGEGGEKKKKKKKEKVTGDKKKEEKCEEDTAVPVEKYEEAPVGIVAEPEEKKGFLDKIKDKLPHKKSEETKYLSPPAPPAPVEPAEESCEAKEKKGILEKIKEKLPGYHSKSPEEDKLKE